VRRLNGRARQPRSQPRRERAAAPGKRRHVGSPPAGPRPAEAGVHQPLASGGSGTATGRVPATAATHWPGRQARLPPPVLRPATRTSAESRRAPGRAAGAAGHPGRGPRARAPEACTSTSSRRPAGIITGTASACQVPPWHETVGPGQGGTGRAEAPPTTWWPPSAAPLVRGAAGRSHPAMVACRAWPRRPVQRPCPEMRECPGCRGPRARGAWRLRQRRAARRRPDFANFAQAAWGEHLLAPPMKKLALAGRSRLMDTADPGAAGQHASRG
jgi:hypothetical protein